MNHLRNNSGAYVYGYIDWKTMCGCMRMKNNNNNKKSGAMMPLCSLQMKQYVVKMIYSYFEEYINGMKRLTLTSIDENVPHKSKLFNVSFGYNSI